MVRIGFDVGGSKIASIALDSKGSVLTQDRQATPRGYEEMLECLATTAIRLGGNTPFSVGVGMPGGIVASRHTIRAVNMPWLDEKPFAADLSNLLQRPVRIANDGNCFTLSEAVDGAGSGYPVVVGITLGTGIGCGIVAHGKILEGRHGIAGEWGHVPFPWRDCSKDPVSLCACGREGCTETVLSAKALGRLYHFYAGKGEDIETLRQDLLANGSDAKVTLHHYADNLARALVSLIHTIDPDAIVLGGTASTIPGLIESVQQAWGKYSLVSPLLTRLAVAAHGPDSGVRGAAYL